MPDGFEFPSSSILPPGEREARAAEVHAAAARGTVTPEQETLLLGTLLGDGHISAAGTFAQNHGWPQREYLWTKYTVLSEFVLGRPSRSKKSEQGYSSARFWTVTASVFASLRSRFYPGGVKTVTQDWLDQIDAAGFLPSVAWWVADDGSRTGPKHSPTMLICTNGFTHPEVDLLCRWLTGRGYPCSVYTAVREGYRPYPMVLFSTPGSVALMRDLLPWTPPRMRYKLAIEGRRDETNCFFCGQAFVLRSLVRRTDLPTFPCCGEPGCREASRRLHYDRWYADPDHRTAQKERTSARLLNMTPDQRTDLQDWHRRWRAENPDKIRQAKQRHLAKKKAEKAAVTWTCAMCPKTESLADGRVDRVVCGECAAERMRLQAKLNYYKKQLARPELPAERRANLAALRAETEALLAPIWSRSKTSASKTSTTSK